MNQIDTNKVPKEEYVRAGLLNLNEQIEQASG